MKKTKDQIRDDQYKNRMVFTEKTDLSNFEDIESEWLQMDGRSYTDLGCSYTGYGNVQIDRNMTDEESQGVMKMELSCDDNEDWYDEKEWDGEPTNEWRHTTDYDIRSLRNTAEQAGLLKKLNKAIKKLNKSGVGLTSEHIWFKISPIGSVKLKTGLSVDEVIGILKFERDMNNCC